MGSFLGHVVPGLFFTLFSLWSTCQVFKRYFVCQKAAATTGDGKGRSKYRNTATHTSTCVPNVPAEGLLKVVATVIGMTGEFVTAFENGKFAHINNAQHMTMFFFFGLNGVCDILMHYRIPVPPNLDYISAVMAFAVEGLLFYYHLHGRSTMDVQVHMFLFYVVVACALSTTLEMLYRKNVLPALCRSYFTLLQGTWFFQVGFILYPPVGEEWDQKDHKQLMITTLIFTWHMAAIFVFTAVVGTVIYLKVKHMDRTSYYRTLRRLPFDVDMNTSKMDREQIQNIIADSEEEEV
ncbi:transmembrane protein 45B-like [Oratosquilla oratoria]|uniref:transmembrane protein 45B-like n=1 Tax=Oratosquilla oratoria TaxID=337810 RepID=UPI003F776260